MTGILLAATVLDGRQAMQRAPWLVGEVVAIITPRNRDRARGLSVEHIYRTMAYAELPFGPAFDVAMTASPCVATSRCALCKDEHGHAPVDTPAALKSHRSETGESK